MIYTENVKKALRLCYAGLKNVLSREGMPVLVDWIVAANDMPDENTTVVCLLHGAIESGVFDLEFIKQQSFSADIIYALEILLRHKELPYKRYLAQLKTCPIAWVVKRGELQQKSVPGRLLDNDLNYKNFFRYREGLWELESLFSTPYCCNTDEIDVQERIIQNRRFQDNILGTMAGGAIGDVIGNMSGHISSHTQLCLATAGGILHAYTHFACVGFNCTEIDCIRYSLLNWQEKQDGLENSFKTSWLWNIPQLCEKRDPDINYLGAVAEGCGSIKRPKNDNSSASCLTGIAPIALYHKNTDSRNDHIKYEMHLAASTAALTHGNKLAWLSCALLVHIISRTVFGGATKGDHLCGFVWEGKQYLFELFGDSEELHQLYETMDKAIRLASNDDNDAENIQKLGNGERVDVCLGVAIYCALRYPLDFDGAIHAAANYSGAAASCVTGQILGAKLGHNRLPPQAIDRIERFDVLREVAGDLTDSCQLRSYSEYVEPKWESKYYTCDFTM